MIKLLHVIAIGALLSSAAYAYTIKYDTLYQYEQLSKVKQRIQREREAIAVLKAEWQHLNRPDRLEVLAERHLQTVPLTVNQIVRIDDVPMRGPHVDGIGRKLEALGIAGFSDSRPTAGLPRQPAPRQASR